MFADPGRREDGRADRSRDTGAGKRLRRRSGRPLCIGALLGATLLAGAANAESLVELMDACTQVMTEGTYAGVADYGVKRIDATLWGSIRDVEGHEMSLLIQLRQDETIHSCSIIGYTFGDDTTVTRPGLSFAQGLALSSAWMDAAQAQPDRAEVAAWGPPTRTVAACPDPAREGFLITVAPATVSSLTNDMADDARPFLFSASRVNTPTQACRFATGG